MYNINDVVVYGTEGICRITDITELKFGGETSEYYILSPIHKSENTVYVPKNNEKVLQRMRKILTKDDALKLIDSLPLEPMEWIPNDRERQMTYKNIMLCGDPREIFSMVSTLYGKQTEQASIGKKLHASDERFLRDAERMMLSELSYVMELRPQEVLTMILSKHK
ncbi:MAG: CarD family transcriptional regulator [Firmicutes bacterium]|nr:CarD family transcriptional regulator [Bacillota bacterium]